MLLVLRLRRRRPEQPLNSPARPPIAASQITFELRSNSVSRSTATPLWRLRGSGRLDVNVPNALRLRSRRVYARQCGNVSKRHSVYRTPPAPRARISQEIWLPPRCNVVRLEHWLAPCSSRTVSRDRMRLFPRLNSCRLLHLGNALASIRVPSEEKLLSARPRKVRFSHCARLSPSWVKLLSPVLVRPSSRCVRAWHVLIDRARIPVESGW
mmetsp:Transcript_25092/g.38430  ORF Transcript_25092/g.38430 Transcript_25092/m.38430 type:complete len:211 (-) Transcript_25092:676-1308(-)